MTNLPPQIICAICKRVLDAYIDESGAEYRHSARDIAQGVTHEPVPVLDKANEVKARCDFCSRDVPSNNLWVVLTKKFAEWSDEYWAADEICARMIHQNQWNRLSQRSRESYEAVHGPMDALSFTLLRTLHQEVRKNMIKPPYRVDS